MSQYLHGVFDLSAYQDPEPKIVEAILNPLTPCDDAWAALIGAKEKREEGFSVSRDGSLSIARR